MSVIQGNSHSGSGYSIANSLRLRASASAYLSRTPASAGNTRTWTWAGWIKRGRLGSQDIVFSASHPSGTSSYDAIDFSGDALRFYLQGSTSANFQTSQVFRDPSAWYHVVLAVDTTQATSTNRVKIYVNGSQVTSFAAAAYPAQNYDCYVNVSGRAHYIGANALSPSPNTYIDGYLSDVYFIDGQALDPNSFGNVDAATGQWVPKKYSGAYGTNGFYLPFNDGSNLTNLCLDRSGNGNNWTATGVSLTAGATYDWMSDTPTNNFAVLNGLKVTSSCSLSESNLKFSSGGSLAGVTPVTMAMTSGKWFGEFTAVSFSGGTSTFTLGLASESADKDSYSWLAKIIGNGTGDIPGSFGSGDVMGLAVDADAKTVQVYKNGASFNSGSYSSSSPVVLGVGKSHAASDCVIACNFGQRPFAYTPPTGFKSLCTLNMPTPPVINPKQHFDTVLATGANIKTTSEAVFPSNFFEWIKDRANANNPQLIDTVRGSSAVLQSNTTAAETTYSAPAGNSVGWIWKAGGAAVANNAGSIASQVSANTTAGFSIVTYTGTGANATVGHGLGVAPKLVIGKRRSGTADWVVWHSSLLGTEYLLLNTTAAKAAAATVWNSAVPTSSVFSLGTDFSLNQSGFTNVAYCFAEVPGFSKIGSYIGNGSSDGPFVYCGFKPRFVMIKRTDAVSSWVIFDAARNTFNVANNTLYANQSIAEFSGATGVTNLDFTSNGFKSRGTDSDFNANGATYIFYAVAESPFNYSTAR